MNNSGIYSMITTFFLVAAIVFIMIGLIYLGQMVTAQEGAAFEGTEVYKKANHISENILQCYGKLTYEKISNKGTAESCTLQFMEGKTPDIKGFSIEVVDFLLCDHAGTTLGDMENCKNRFVYYLGVDKNYVTCLGRMTVCS